MKQSLLLLTLACALNACAPRSTSTRTDVPSPAHQAEGGINGGGGGTLPAEPISTLEVHDIIQRAKVDLALYYKLQIRYYIDKYSSSAEKKVFGARPNIFDALYSTNIEVVDDRPCYDADGNAVDGSVHASQPNMICISAYSIAPKLIAERARTEILALITHELSHTLGADEDEARDLQQQLSRQYQPSPGHLEPDAESFVSGLSGPTDEFEHHAHGAEAALERGTDNEVDKALSVLNEDMRIMSDKTTSMVYSILDHQEYDAFFVEWERLITLSLTVDQSNPDRAAYLDSLFKGRKQITYCEKFYGHSPCDNQFGDELLTRTSNREEAKAEFAKIRKFISALAQNIRNLQFSSKPSELPLPNQKVSPFAAFKGDFDVVSTNCDGPVRFVDKATRFTIEENGPGRPLHLKVTVPNGYGDDGEFESGSITAWGSTSTDISGGQDWAERVSQTGDRWGTRQLQGFYQERTKLEKIGTSYRLTRETTSIDQRNKLAQTTHACTFELARLQP